MLDVNMPVSDAVLLRAWRDRGDETGLAELCRRHTGLVRATCLRLGAHDVDEAVQAVFIILAQKPGAIGDASRLAGWLVGTARYVVSHQRRAHVRRLRHEREAAVMHAARSMPSEGLGTVWEDARELLDEALDRLSPGRREALIRFYLQGQPQSEVAAELGCSVDAVKTRIHEGLVALRGFFARRGLTLGLAALATGLASEASAVGAGHVGPMATSPAAQELAGQAMAGLRWQAAWASVGTPALFTSLGLLLAGLVAVLVMTAGSEADRAAPQAAPATDPSASAPPHLLFHEDFEDRDFRARGWYDNAEFMLASRTRSDSNAAVFHFRRGEPLPMSGGPSRILFPPSSGVRIRYRIAYSQDWDPSTSMVQILLLTTADQRFTATSAARLSCGVGITGGAPFVSLQDHGGDAGDPETPAGPSRRYVLSPEAPVGRWHEVEVRFRLNRIVAGTAIADGSVSYHLDGRELWSRSDIIFRLPEHPSMLFNQVMVGPYASISPRDQSLWIDDFSISAIPEQAVDRPNP